MAQYENGPPATYMYMYEIWEISTLKSATKLKVVVGDRRILWHFLDCIIAQISKQVCMLLSSTSSDLLVICLIWD